MDVRKESRHFSREIKRDAVHLVLEKWFPVRKVARDLDIHPKPLHQWRRMLLADGAFVGTGNLMPEDAKFNISSENWMRSRKNGTSFLLPPAVIQTLHTKLRHREHINKY